MTISTIILQAAAASGGLMETLQMPLMLVLIFGVMYFMMIRPQQKRQKELNNFRNTLENGTKIITAGGIYGIIKEVKETSVLVEVDSNVTLRLDKSMVMRDNSDIAAANRK